jgi:hypothetical protein
LSTAVYSKTRITEHNTTHLAPARTPVKWQRTFLMAAILFTTLQASATPAPVWHRIEAPVRAVCVPPRDHASTLLVSIPRDAPLPAGQIHCIATTSNGATLPCVTHTTDPSNVWVTVSSIPRRETEEILIYCQSTPPKHPARTPSTQPEGASVFFKNLAGVSKPNTWERYRYMFTRGHSHSHEKTYPHTALTPFKPLIPAPKADEDKDSRRRRLRGARNQKFCLIESWVDCPESGDYTLAIQTSEPAFLVVDGTLALSYLPDYAKNAVTDTWGASTSLPLTAGPHHMQLFTIAQRSSTTTVGWTLPSQHQDPQITPIPPENCIGGTRPSAQRMELRDRIVHPGSIITANPTYRFLDCPTIFAPLSIKNWSTSWASKNHTTTWLADGKPLPLSPSGGTAILPLGSTAPLELFTLDALGFHRTTHQSRPTSLTIPTQYAIDLSVANIPAVRYAEDAIWPELHIVGTAPGSLIATVTWEIYRDHSGPPQQGITDIRNISRNRQIIRLPRLEVSEVQRINWHISHANIMIKQGTVRFLTPPFASLPTSIHEVALLNARKEQIVLVPHRFAGDYTQPPIHLSHAFGSLLCIDDQITINNTTTQTPYEATLEKLLDGPDRPIVTLIHPPAKNGANSTAYAPLIKFPWLTQQPQHHDVVILSLSATDIQALPDVETFERHIAAISDIISATRNQRVVWLTPPPPPDAPFPQRTNPPANPRVADARRIPVADLYSACLARFGGPIRARSSAAALSTELQELTASLVARALLSNTPPHSNPLTRLIP